MPSSYQPWVEPVQGEHSRLYVSRRKRLPVGDITGTFVLGEVVTGGTSGATGYARVGLTAGYLHYLPIAGTFVSGEVLTGGTSGATTTTTGAPMDETISLQTAQARAFGSLSSYWAACKSEAATRRSASAYPNSWFESRDFEYVANLAFTYLIDPFQTLNADRAIAIALHIAGLGLSDSSTNRDWGRLIAFVYDWCYDRLTSSQRATLRNAAATLAEALYAVNPTEYNWGTSHGSNVAAILIYAAILGDGSSSENALWASRMDYCLDQHLKGGTDATFMAGFRFFGDADGGTNKGCGAFGYARAQQNFYYRTFPGIRSAILVDWDVTEAWWNKMLHWFLAMWRPDRTFFTKGEAQGLAPYAIDTTIHAIQVASRENNAYGEHCMWLEAEAEDRNAGNIWGPWNLYQVIFREPSRQAIRPTAERLGKHMHLFRNAGHVVFRNGHGVNDCVFSWDFEPEWTGGHTKRRCGNLQMAGFGAAVIRDAGSYDPNQDFGYKVIGDAVETGHRWAFTKRAASGGRMWRIFDSDEISENDLAFGRWKNANTGRFGVLNGTSFSYNNDGGQLWPKGAGSKYQPDSLADLLATSAWRRATFALDPPVEDSSIPSRFAYGVADLEPAYYASKCTKFLQHVLYIKPGTIPGWSYPILMVVEDISAHVDSVKGKRTCVLMLNSGVQATGAAASLQWDVGGARLFSRVLKPASIEVAHIAGPVIEGETFAATNVKSGDDPASWRAELNVTASAADQQWVTFYFMCPAGTAAPTTPTLIDDATWIGGTVLGIDCKVKKASPYQASVGSSGDTTPPAAPTGLAGTAGSIFSDLNWNDNAEGDLAGYEVFRADPL